VRPWMFGLAALAACDDTLFGPDPGPPDVYDPTCAGVAALVEDHCAECHSGGVLVLPDAIFADAESGAGDLVVAGDPAASLLWRVLVGELDDGDLAAMPLGRGLLPLDSVDHVRVWIEAGASCDDVDDDGDGYGILTGDCDDGDPTVHPDAVETCDGRDEDCDGDEDDGGGFLDGDGDGHGDPAATAPLCDADVLVGDDCDDADEHVHPGADELCNSYDDDCDAVIDADATVGPLRYEDGDRDGFGDPETAVVSCDPIVGMIDQGDDCDDHDRFVSPLGVETCDGYDEDCNGVVDDATGFADVDGDGFGDPNVTAPACDVGGTDNPDDCDDDDEDEHPGAVEVCDGDDDDCDGQIDVDAPSPPTWYFDADRDTWGDPAVTVAACAAPPGTVARADDCDDDEPRANPSATEVCDGFDDDCDGDVDEADAADATLWYTDADDDDYGAGAPVASCSPVSGRVARDGDCRDGDDAYNPGATETCVETRDLNCDGAVGAVDHDEDGHFACTECDDGDPDIHPGAVERCNAKDDDCDDVVDEDAPAATVWWPDGDRDGAGAKMGSVTACFAPSGFVAATGDCNDGLGSVRPGAPEGCNSVDDDCDDLVDEDAVDAATWFADGDSDSFGAASNTRRACAQPSGFVARSGDCNDGIGAVFPGADERCNGRDDDCDVAVDEQAVDAPTWYRDVDVDTWGSAVTAVACSAPSGFVARTGDCNDAQGGVFPGANETCNNRDDDCDLTIDEDPVNPPTWFLDGDSDTYGTSATTATGCVAPPGYFARAGDCDDLSAAVNPGVGFDAPNGRDDDCDGRTDEDRVVLCAEVEPILSTECSGCHGAPFPSGGLDLGPGSCGRMVNVRSFGSNLDYVEPGSLAQSYLWHKLNGTQGSIGGSGGQMPPGSSLSSTQLDLIRMWIASGAQ
jgi:hypothetical protein